ncbi:MAG: hypothetical protein SPE33_09670 [[Pasteurella] aerogenes]|nr:hypothetical protein [[Pasteurella] aerogenes]
MALFKYLTKKQAVAEGYDHKGTLFGIPVFIGDLESDAPRIITGNFIPDWVLDVAESLYFMIEGWVKSSDECYEPCYKIYITECLTDGEPKKNDE